MYRNFKTVLYKIKNLFKAIFLYPVSQIEIMNSVDYDTPFFVMGGSATTEAVLDGKTGYVLKKHDSLPEIYAKIDSLLEDTNRWSKELSIWVNAHSPEIIYKNIITIYNEICHTYNRDY